MPTEQTYWCTSCRGFKQAWDSDKSRCWSCDRYTLERDHTTVIACGRSLEVSTTIFNSTTGNWSEETHYCKASGCFNQFSDLNAEYCSSHSHLKSNFNQSYSYSYSGSSAPRCQAEDCNHEISEREVYCPFCKIEQSLIRRVESKTNLKQVKKAEEFETWWNKNLATVINGGGYFTIWLLVYDDKDNQIKQFSNSSNYYDLSEAKDKAFTLRVNLNGNNPILYIHPKADEYTSFGNIVCEPYVKIVDLPYRIVRIERTLVSKALALNMDGTVQEVDIYDTITMIDLENPRSYLKPLDIVWVKKRKLLVPYYHVGVYLGNNEICHIAGDILNKKGARIENWREFIKDACEEMFAKRVIVPFKHNKLIAQEITWAGRVFHQEGQYNLADRNCEHFANMMVLGINFSKQVEEKPVLISKLSNRQPHEVNNNKLTVNLQNEINSTNNQLGQISDSVAQQIEARIYIPPKNSWWL